MLWFHLRTCIQTPALSSTRRPAAAQHRLAGTPLDAASIHLIRSHHQRTSPRYNRIHCFTLIQNQDRSTRPKKMNISCRALHALKLVFYTRQILHSHSYILCPCLNHLGHMLNTIQKHMQDPVREVKQWQQPPVGLDFHFRGKIFQLLYPDTRLGRDLSS